MRGVVQRGASPVAARPERVTAHLAFDAPGDDAPAAGAHALVQEFEPETGQFTQQDPIGIAGGANVYGFANGDPINFSDPFGLKDCRKVSCPSIETVASDPSVVKAGDEMFKASQSDGKERGAFLFNRPDGTIVVGSVVTAQPGTVNMGKAPDDAIGMIHTHPDLTAARPGSSAIPGGRPSGDDHNYVRNNHVHGVVEQRNSTFYISWDRPDQVQRKPQSRPERTVP